MHFVIHSTIAYTLPFNTVESSSKHIAVGSAVAVVVAAGLALSMYSLFVCDRLPFDRSQSH
jgi:hypothetical protein